MNRKSFVFAMLLVIISTASFAADLLSLVPYDSIVVLDVNLEKISSQPALKALYENLLPKVEGEYAADFEKLGIDPQKDIKNAVMFITSNQKFAVLAEGTFDTITTCDAVEGDEQIQQYYKLTSVGGLPALYNENFETATITLVDQRTLAFGDMAILEEIGKLYNEKEEGKSIKKNPNFIYMSNRIDLEKQIWGVAIGGKSWASSVKTAKSGIDKVRMTFFDADYSDKELNCSVTALVARNSELEALVDSLVELMDGLKEFVSTVPGMTQIFDYAQVMDDHSNMARIELKMPTEKFLAVLASVGEFLEKNEH